MNSNIENLQPGVAHRLMKNIRKLSKNPPEGITIHVEDDNISVIQADIIGPECTPYEGGVFRVKLCLTSDYPHSPPKGYFLTKVFHPNVSKFGEICVNTLKKDWKPEHGLEHVFIVIRCLLIYPNAESALNEEAGKLLLEAYEEFAKRAKLWTQIHAKPKKVVDNCITTTSTSSSSSSSGVQTRSSDKNSSDKNINNDTISNNNNNNDNHIATNESENQKKMANLLSNTKTPAKKRKSKKTKKKSSKAALKRL